MYFYLIIEFKKKKICRQTRNLTVGFQSPGGDAKFKPRKHICNLHIEVSSLFACVFVFFPQTYLEQAQELVVNENILLQTLG